MPKSLLHITEDLIRLHTTADRTDELRAALHYIENYFSDLPELVIRHYECNNKPSMVVSFTDTLTPDVMLVGHIDVVPADAELFEPCVEDGYLRGRGACDMKSEIAVMMELVREIYEAGERPSLALMLTSDEEVSGQDGVRYLIHEVGYRTRVALVPDGGESAESVILKNKGILHVRVTARGLAAHGSRPWIGRNAIDGLFEAYTAIQKLFPPTDDPNRWYSTCIMGTITGGTATNQIPDNATCTLDIRFTENYALDEIVEKITVLAGDYASVEIIASGEPMYTPPSNEFVMLYQEAVRSALGKEPFEEITHGAIDGRFFAELGIPVITSRPRSGGQHSASEWVDLASLHDFKNVYREAIRKFLSTENLTKAEAPDTIELSV